VQSNLLNNSDILIVDVSTGVSSRLTFDAAADGIPIWSPIGDRVAFASARRTPLPFPSVLYERAASGAGEDQQIMPSALAELHIPQAWSPDGRYIVFGSVPLTRAQSGGDIWALPLDGDRKPFPLVQSTTFRAGAAQFSPDGRWLAYTTNESGTNQIVVRPFPDVNKGTWQVPGSGNYEPKWRGREILYLAPGQQMMSVTVTAENGGVTFSQPVALFQTGLPPQSNPPQFWFDVTDDGQHFLLNLPTAAPVPQQPGPAPPPKPLNVVVNWTSLLTK
jgi:Tol biopolymer transport system component